MNDLDSNEFSLVTNFLCPTLKLASKARYGGENTASQSRQFNG